MSLYIGFVHPLSYDSSRRVSRAPAGRLLLMAVSNYYQFKQLLLRENLDTEFARVQKLLLGACNLCSFLPKALDSNEMSSAHAVPFTFRYVKGSETIALGAAISAVCILAVALRLFTRRLQKVKIGLDDQLIVGGLVSLEQTSSLPEKG